MKFQYWTCVKLKCKFAKSQGRVNCLKFFYCNMIKSCSKPIQTKRTFWYNIVIHEDGAKHYNNEPCLGIFLGWPERNEHKDWKIQCFRHLKTLCFNNAGVHKKEPAVTWWSRRTSRIAWLFGITNSNFWASKPPTPGEEEEGEGGGGGGGVIFLA